MNGAAVLTVVISIVGAVGAGVLASLANGLFSRGKVKAEAENIATSTTLLIIKDLRQEIARLQEEISRLSERLKVSEDASEEIRHRADSAEARAEQAEYNVIVLGRGMKACNARIAYLTALLERNGIPTSPWTPPEGIEMMS